MSARYLFVVKGVQTHLGYEPAREVLLSRIRDGMWPLYLGTPHKRTFEEGDRVAFYIAGKMDPDWGHVVGVGELAGPTQRFASEPRFSFAVPIIDFSWLPKPTPIKPLVAKLAFVKDPRSWGAALQSGVVRLTDSDFAALTRSQPDT